MSSTPHPVVPPCTHERRPGTTVCLLCRQEARLAASDRRNKLLLRGSAVAIIVAVIAVGMSNAAALRGRTLAKATAATDSAAATKVDVVPADSLSPQTATPRPASAAATVTTPTTPTTQPAPTLGAPANVAASAPLSPVIRVGDTPLGNGAVATRSDSGVLVAFDTPDLRTRTPEKFEQFLRATLPQIYGAPIEAQLKSIPLGKIVGQGNLLYELPTRGIRLPIQPGWHLEVYPEIRPGVDAPLVVRYRTSIVKE